MKKNRHSVSRVSIKNQKHHIFSDLFPVLPVPGAPLEFLQGLGKILKAGDLRRFFDLWMAACSSGLLRHVMLGGAVIKTGMGPLLAEAVRKGAISSVSMNSAAAIHDFELALAAKTSENVGQGLSDGTFGMTEETGSGFNQAINEGVEKGLGLGNSVASWIVEQDFPHKELSLLAACHEQNIPLTMHVAIGADITHQHPEFDGAATGKGAERDFDALIVLLSGMRAGSCVANLGSAVILPEVFLKALTVARNTNTGIEGFHTAVFDMLSQYRPAQNVMKRPSDAGGGSGFYFIGHHEIMLPLFFGALLQKINE
jgi:hypothetical protein